MNSREQRAVEANAKMHQEDETNVYRGISVASAMLAKGVSYKGTCCGSS